MNMPTDLRETYSTLPSALVLGVLCADQAGNPHSEALARAGFTRAQVEGYLERCANRPAGSAPSA
jgi:hypothetical protein